MSIARDNMPNAKTLAALEEVEEMKKNPSLGKSYTDVDEMMKELLSGSASEQSK
jgi:DNA-damage-inducible protein J